MVKNGITVDILACSSLPTHQHSQLEGEKGDGEHSAKVPHPGHICCPKKAACFSSCSVWGILLSVFSHDKYLKRLQTHIIILLCGSNNLTLASVRVDGWHFQHFSLKKEDKRHIRSLRDIAGRLQAEKCVQKWVSLVVTPGSTFPMDGQGLNERKTQSGNSSGLTPCVTAIHSLERLFNTRKLVQIYNIYYGYFYKLHY